MFLSNIFRRTAGYIATRHWYNARWSGHSPAKLQTIHFSTQNIESYEPSPSGIPDVRFRRAIPQHLPAVRDLLTESFFKDEPILKALHMDGKIDPAYIAKESKLVLQGLTILAIDETNDNIIAAAVNRVVLPEEILKPVPTLDEIQCPNAHKMTKFWHELTLRPNVFSLFNVPAYMEITFLVTTPAARGKGLAEKLTRESLRLGNVAGIPLAVVYCTNIASARVATKLSMKLIAVHCISRYFKGEDLLALTKVPSDKIYVFATVM